MSKFSSPQQSHSARDLIKVLCEACLKTRQLNCSFCKGVHYYYWDPKSLFCYDRDGIRLLIENESGTLVEVIRSPNAEAQSLDLATMLRCIQLWVAEKPIRKWKLWVDEKGWHSSLWSNYYKKLGTDCSGDCLEQCISSSYQAIVSGNKSQKRLK